MALKGIPATDNKNLYQAYESFANEHLEHWTDDESSKADSTQSKCLNGGFKADPTRVLLSKTMKLREYFPNASGEMHFAICACAKEQYIDLVQQTALAGPLSAKPTGEPQRGALFELLLKFEHFQEVLKQ